MWLSEMTERQLWMVIWQPQMPRTTLAVSVEVPPGNDSNHAEGSKKTTATIQELAIWAACSYFGHTIKSIRACSYFDCVRVLVCVGGGVMPNASAVG